MKFSYQKELLLSLVILGFFVLIQFLPEYQQDSDEVVFEMTTKQWEFEPNQIIVQQGQTVVIRLVSTDVLMVLLLTNTISIHSSLQVKL